MVKVVVASTLVAGAAAHGSMVLPKPRNVGSSAVNPSHGADKSCKGDACYWYQVGCHIGCPSCTLEGKDLYPAPHCTAAEGLMEPTLPDEFRTWDPLHQSACGDFTKYNPWRAPGKAPVADPCGVASGYTPAWKGKPDIPAGYDQAALGSKVLPEGEKTSWKAGGVATVGWALSAQHGGGYSYRLCPKGKDVTEECFQSNHLSFTSKNTTIHYNDGSQADFTISTRTYTDPDGKQWRTNPIPGCACDIGLSGCGRKPDLDSNAGGDCAGHYPSFKAYKNHGSATPFCSAGTMFQPGWLNDGASAGFLVGGANPWNIEDEVQVPDAEGEYILSWRWDCEETDQVWNSCADIVITSGPTPTTTAAPPTPPTPTPPTPTPTPPGKNCKASLENPTCKIDFTQPKACYYHGCKECADETGIDCAVCCEGCELEDWGKYGKLCSASKGESVAV